MWRSKEVDIASSKKRIAELFRVEVLAISKHLQTIFDSNKIEENSVVSILEKTAQMVRNTRQKTIA